MAVFPICWLLLVSLWCLSQGAVTLPGVRHSQGAVTLPGVRHSQGAVTLPGVMHSQVPGALSMVDSAIPRPLPPPLSCLHPCQKLSCKAGTTCRLVQRSSCLASSCTPEPVCVQQTQAMLETPGEVSACSIGDTVLGEEGRELQCGPGSPCPRGTSCVPTSLGVPGRCCLLPSPGCLFREDVPGTLARSRQATPTSGSKFCPRPSLLSRCLSDCLTTADCRFGEFCCPSICGTKACVKVFEIVPDRASSATSGGNTAPSSVSSLGPDKDGGPLALGVGIPEENFVRKPGRLSRERVREKRMENRLVMGEGIRPPVIEASISLAQADPASVAASNFRCPDLLRVSTCRNQCTSDADCGVSGRKCCRTRCNTGICAGSYASVAVWVGR